ncbi:MAG: hypothetical protein HY525_02940 [Betaproteobacteria bacterium]|nr:hypothetical protein [Betaproteobacteria bacterium]
MQCIVSDALAPLELALEPADRGHDPIVRDLLGEQGGIPMPPPSIVGKGLPTYLLRAAALYSTCQAKALLYFSAPVGATTLFAKGKHGAVIVRFLQPVKDQLAHRFCRRFHCAARSAGYGLDPIGVESLQIAMFGCSAHGLTQKRNGNL